MRLSVLFLVAISMALAGSVTIKSLVFPAQTSTSYTELVPLRPLNVNAFTLCMRVATEDSSQRDMILFAYRTESTDELNVWREVGDWLSLYLTSSGDGVYFKVPVLGALETHLCVTWDASSGAVALFLNGRKSLFKIYRKGHVLQSGGRVILGQDLDSMSGDFDASQSFVGEISDVNMWDSVLSASTIQDLYSGMRAPRGNIFDWETAVFDVYGQVEVVSREL
ncbi:pentraxin fusion protein-like [Seriola dumerili]|uniref:Pentraxin family member n=1 Tax=Seriola dumerili TaxID=41447 RepID=A0A3B4T955_SERDU|nr:pentraxin fusion protein-like [Seriola dumerili]